MLVRMDSHGALSLLNYSYCFSLVISCYYHRGNHCEYILFQSKACTYLSENEDLANRQNSIPFCCKFCLAQEHKRPRLPDEFDLIIQNKRAVPFLSPNMPIAPNTLSFEYHFGLTSALCDVMPFCDANLYRESHVWVNDDLLHCFVLAFNIVLFPSIGANRFVDNLTVMMGYRLPFMMKIFWKFITPIFTIVSNHFWYGTKRAFKT